MNKLWRAVFTLASLPISGCAQPVVHMVFAIRNEEGAVVTNARVGMSTFKRWIPGPEFGKEERSRVEGRTDTNGLVHLTLESERGDLSVLVKQMPGYYLDNGNRFQMTKAASGRWEPWGRTNVLVVRRIVNPIPMYARIFNGTVPTNGRPVGFDMIKGEWVPPYGKGEVADFVFRAEWKSYGRNQHRVLRFDAKMDLTFSNADDGICEVRIPYHAPPRGSVYRMPRLSPESGYVSRLSWKKYESDDGQAPAESPDLNYFFRVRTKRDAEGRIVSALYGKIHGPIEFWVNDQGASFAMWYYLNPTPNDRNTEFAVGKNLMQPPPSTTVGAP